MNNIDIFKGLTIIMIVTVLSVVAACASGNKGGGRPQGPPPEAIEACEGKAEGDSVTFAGRGGEDMTATCQMVEDQLVAVPEGHKRP